jgi:hypothetical protein
MEVFNATFAAASINLVALRCLEEPPRCCIDRVLCDLWVTSGNASDL